MALFTIRALLSCGVASLARVTPPDSQHRDGHAGRRGSGLGAGRASGVPSGGGRGSAERLRTRGFLSHRRAG